jgi:hypothetical protein
MSSDYIEQYRILHKQGVYGTSSEKLFDDILPLIYELNPQSVLDYGCGQSKLVDMFHISNTHRYDPAIPAYDTLPEYKTLDLVICTDVLEHIPEDSLFSTLAQIYLYSKNVIFSVAVVPAVKILPNGENAHCTVKNVEWWIDKIKEVFPIVNIVKNDRDVKYILKTW